MKHSPQPWRFVDVDDLQAGVFAENNNMIATVHGDDHETVATLLADARLISSAPEMLDALVTAFRLMENATPEVRRALNYNEIDAVIRKAKGES